MTPPSTATTPEASTTRRGLRQRVRKRLRRGPRPQGLPTQPESAQLATALAAFGPSATEVSVAPVVSLDAAGRAQVLIGQTGAITTPVWAIPYAYAPAVGDMLWVIGRGDRHYVIGVLRGRGTSLVWFLGDVALRARGRLKLSASESVRVVGRELNIRAESLLRVTEALEVVAGEARTQVRGLARLVAGRVQRVIAGEDTLRARSVEVLARDLVKIDADLLKLG